MRNFKRKMCMKKATKKRIGISIKNDWEGTRKQERVKHDRKDNI